MCSGNPGYDRRGPARFGVENTVVWASEARFQPWSRRKEPTRDTAVVSICLAQGMHTILNCFVRSNRCHCSQRWLFLPVEVACLCSPLCFDVWPFHRIARYYPSLWRIVALELLATWIYPTKCLNSNAWLRDQDCQIQRQVVYDQKMH